MPTKTDIPDRQQGISLATLIFFLLASVTLTHCSKASDSNGSVQPPITGQAAFTVQNDFTDPALVNQHHNAAKQADGKLVVAQSDGGLLRLTQDGKPDASFKTIKFATDALLSDIAIQPDGKILVSGRLFITGHPNIVRINSDGSIDNGFNAAPLIDGVPSNILLRPDGKILVCGTMSYANNGTKYHVMRLNTDGSLDKDFVSELGYLLNGGANYMALAPDGKILVSGDLAYAKNGQQFRNVVRLAENGSVDPSFDFNQQLKNGASSGSILTVALDKNNKILIGGAFYNIGSSAITYNCVARLNSDGSLDLAFTSPVTGTYYVTSILPLNNGNILVGRRLKTLFVDIPDFFTVLNSKGDASDFRLGFNKGGIDEIVQESATSFILVGVFRPASGQFGLVRLVQK